MTRAQLVFAGLALVAAGAVAVLALSHRSDNVRSRRQIYFRGEAIASVADSVGHARLPRGAVERVRRVVHLDALGGADVVVEASLDADGFAVAARYNRPGQRIVELKSGALVVDGAITVLLPPQPVVLVEFSPRLRTTASTAVVLVDLSSAEFVAAHVERRGPEIVVLVDDRVVIRARPEGRRAGPGAFVEDDAAPGRPSADAAVAQPGVVSVRGHILGGVASHLPALVPTTTAAHLVPGPFIESTAAAVVAFATPLCRSSDTDTARVIAEAVRPLVDPHAIAVTPGAVRMLQAGGDCDGAAALVVASLRACGHPARAVVGYRLVDPGTDSARLVPHAVAELYRQSAFPQTAGTWWRIDATVPALGDLDDVFIPVAEGLGGALTMGRVLGVLEPADVVEGAHAGP